MTFSYNEASAADAMPADSGSVSRCQGSQPVHPGRAELVDFITATRRELQTLSQTLAAALDEHAVPESEVTSPASECVAPLPAKSVASSDEPAPACSQPTATAPCPRPTQLAAHEATPIDTDTDPLARLQAIKLRLAKQIASAT